MANKTGIGGFKKGVIPWNKNSKGIMQSNKTSFKKGHVVWNKDKKCPQLSVSNPNKSHAWTENQKEFLRLHRPMSKENHPNWISDRTKLVKNEKKHLDGRYRDWMNGVKNRDNWKCKINNADCKGHLESHHILNWKDYPELRYEITNGITLCHAHHPRGREREAELSPYFQKLVAEGN